MSLFSNVSTLAVSTLFICSSALANSFVQSPSSKPVLDKDGNCVRIGSSSGGGVDAACEPTDRVILLPSADGSVGAVVITTRDNSTRTLTQAYGAVRVDGEGSVEDSATSEEEINSEFGGLLAAQPAAPTTYTLRFESGTSDLTSESIEEIQRLISDLRQRPAPEIRVIGHTDTVGSAEDNDRLSLERAQSILSRLTTEGVPFELLEAVGRGERDPEIATGDNRAEPANRRVELSVR